jgi:hypothetical protein
MHGALIPLLLLLSPAYSQSRSTSYNCVPEFSGGVRYNSAAKRWEGSVFDPNSAASKFILKLTYLGRHKEISALLLDIDEYTVTISQPVDKIPEFCLGYDNSLRIETLGEEHNTIKCVTPSNGYDYIISINSHRFLRAYIYGYTDGVDNDENTPSITGGTCTEINE